jgi:hypothetical protein
VTERSVTARRGSLRPQGLALALARQNQPILPQVYCAAWERAPVRPLGLSNIAVASHVASARSKDFELDDGPGGALGASGYQRGARGC